MEQKKTYEKPELLEEDEYQTAYSEHCHEVKECDPYPAKS